MKKIAIIGTDNGHAHMYSAFFNGWSEVEPLPLRNEDEPLDPAVCSWAEFSYQLKAAHNDVLQGWRVSRIWSSSQPEAERIARACGIPHVCDSPEEAAHGVDAVMVLSESPDEHLAHARAALTQALPTYIDKPLARTSSEAEEIFAFANKHGAPCFSGSAFRYSPELLAIRDAQRRLLGNIRSIYIHCPITIPLYVSHAIEMANVFVSDQYRWVHALAATDRQLVLMQGTMPLTVVIDHVNIGVHPRYSGALHGEDAFMPFKLEKLWTAPLGLLQAFVDFAHSGVPPILPQETIATMRLSEAIVESLNSGSRVVIQR